MEALKLWTEDEDNALRRLYPSAVWYVLLEAFPGRSHSAVYKRAFKIGVKRTGATSPRPIKLRRWIM